MLGCLIFLRILISLDILFKSPRLPNIKHIFLKTKSVTLVMKTSLALVFNPSFLKDFDCDFLAGQNLDSFAYLAEGALSKRLAKNVIADILGFLLFNIFIPAVSFS